MFRIIILSGVELIVLRRLEVELLGPPYFNALARSDLTLKIKITLLLIRVRIKTRALKCSELSY